MNQQTFIEALSIHLNASVFEFITAYFAWIANAVLDLRDHLSLPTNITSGFWKHLRGAINVMKPLPCTKPLRTTKSRWEVSIGKKNGENNCEHEHLQNNNNNSNNDNRAKQCLHHASCATRINTASSTLPTCRKP
eukprot:scaffold178453_cov21-Tisochrysis_lutea.AAC.1